MEHGGNVALAAQHYQLPLHEWLDLSTGINPHAYPAAIPSGLAGSAGSLLSQLPYLNKEFIAAAKAYYSCDTIAAVSGSQQAIHLLPLIRRVSSLGSNPESNLGSNQAARVAILSPTYSEHALCWQRAGHDVTEVTSIDDIDKEYDVVIITNPNNPTGDVYAEERLLTLHNKLQNKNGWLVIDEAFMDCEPENSLTSVTNKPGLIVLRSLGKFFGMAGIRIGFVTGDKEIVQSVAQYAGPWPVSGLSLHVAYHCLRDEKWQQVTRLRLAQQSEKLNNLLAQCNLTVKGKTNLFSWLERTDAADIHDALASMGIWLRYFPANTKYKASLRVGLPGNDMEFARLEHALKLIL